ncbi:hypothetical protein IWQ56_004355 [Coemansia nantahalensis]|nr:hypothetical protein IWQ56_004355 [Coemansia nantahalensis]
MMQRIQRAAQQAQPPSPGAADHKVAVSYEYRTVTQAEIRMVQAAMPGVTWRHCANGHMYAVGECGNPAMRGRCLECNIALGG